MKIEKNDIGSKLQLFTEVLAHEWGRGYHIKFSFQIGLFTDDLILKQQSN